MDKKPDYIGVNGIKYWLTPGAGPFRQAKAITPHGQEMFVYIRTDYEHLFKRAS